ncbi:MAG: hypothetical protein M2R45_02033 [Verrucomicrobia subdivision 3 bacterium]|nr:hypothetical protein [Limisphaerales bacterium]MCS1414852.1 hypothetical protein [Limisphaerales bacterium]
MGLFQRSRMVMTAAADEPERIDSDLRAALGCRLRRSENFQHKKARPEKPERAGEAG